MARREPARIERDANRDLATRAVFALLDLGRLDLVQRIAADLAEPVSATPGSRSPGRREALTPDARRRLLTLIEEAVSAHRLLRTWTNGRRGEPEDKASG